MSLPLAIVGILAMLAQIVLIQQFLLHGFLTGSNRLGMEGHEGQFLQNHSIVDSIVGISAPCEGAMAMNQNSGNIISGLSFEGLDNHVSGFQLILAADLFRGHLPGTGNFAVEVVAVGSAVGRNAPPSLGP